MSNSSIIRPHCNKSISLDDALTGQIRASMELEFARTYEKKLKEDHEQDFQLPLLKP